MALQALHEHFWPGDGIVNNTPVEPANYPAWQGGISCAALVVLALPSGALTWFGLVIISSVLAPAFVGRLPKRWQQRIHGWIRAYVPDWLWLAWRLTVLYRSPLYAQARIAVRSVSVTPGMREPEMWSAIGSRMAQRAGVGENVFRHLLALEQLGPITHKRIHEADVALELAYLVRKER